MIAALFIYLFLLVFYVLYIAAINIVEEWDSIAPWLKCMVWPVPLVMVGLFDIPFQIVGATVLFWDWPKEWTLTSRLARYRSPSTGPGIRKDVANTLCTQALNPFAPSKKHC